MLYSTFPNVDVMSCSISSYLLCPRRPVSLNRLVKERPGIDIQSGEHDSIEDARSALAVYKSVQTQWENMMAEAISNANVNGGMLCHFTACWQTFWDARLRYGMLC